MACLITFKVEIDMKSGLPSRELTQEARSYFKTELGIDVKTSDEAVAEPKVAEYIKKCIE